MEKLRFATASDLFQAFPTAEQDVGAAAMPTPALDFARGLAASGNLLGAVSFCAYLLSRREATWWACQCVKSSPLELTTSDRGAVEAAEAWVREPEEAQRLAAHRRALMSDARAPATWTAFAAAFAGQSFGANEFGPMAIPAHLTARAARTVFLLAGARLSSPAKDEYLRACLDRAIGLAERQ
jgi:hypothetical protein